jgi:hypothetical protein
MPKVLEDTDFGGNDLLNARIDVGASSDTGWLRHKILTRAELDALRDSNSLISRQIYFISDDNRIAIAEALNLYHAFQNETETVIDSGSNANGSYIKWADGTMFCRLEAIIDTSVAADTYTEVTWTYPVSFLAGTVPDPSAHARSFNDAGNRQNAARFLRTVGIGNGVNSGVIGVVNLRTSSMTVRVDAEVWGRWK